MKRLFFKHILRAKFIANNKFFWKWGSAFKTAEAETAAGRRCFIYSIDYGVLYTPASYRSYSADVHPDAYHFNPYQ